MTATFETPGHLVVAGRGEAVDARRDRFKLPAIKAIRYADPAAWLTANAVANAIEASGRELCHDRTGVVVTSAEGPAEATAAMNEAARQGSSSPIRFPASNAGSLAGLTSIAFTFRGPTLMLTMPPARGVPVALLLARAWLLRGVAEHMVVAAHGTPVGGRALARCLLLGAEGTPFDPARDEAWLAGALGALGALGAVGAVGAVGVTAP